MENTLVQPQALTKWDKAYAAGSDKSYPNLDLVRLEHWFFNHKPGKLLEYAHGCGENLIHLLKCGHQVEALDASIEAHKLCKSKLTQYPDLQANANFTHLSADSKQLPYPDEVFDYINCISVISLLGSKERVEQLLQEFARVMKPSAKIIIDINSPNSDFARDSKYLGSDVYLNDAGTENEHPCYCPEKDTFVELIDKYFSIDDVGYSAHKLMHSEIHEHIICAHKSE